MNYALDPHVIDEARRITGSTSDEQLGQVFLEKTGATIRNWRAGKTCPDMVSLAKLRKLTGIPLDRMVLQPAA